MLGFEEARRLILAEAKILGSERVPLESADRRILAEDVFAADPLPRFDYSAMDGYALNTLDLDASKLFEIEMEVIGESAAGCVAPTLVSRTACRIFTGAPMPIGSNAVLMQEAVKRSGDRISFEHMPQPGEHVRHKGEDLAVGALALKRGTRLGPGHLSLLASLDRPSVLVARRPIVTVLGSGDELRSPGDPPRPGSIPESNAFFVAAQARRAGAVVRRGPFIPDAADAALAAIEGALASTDLLVTIGGVSVGDHDVVRPALEQAGVYIAFYKVAMKPGKPITVGRKGSTWVIGLPGNPASASLTFLLFGVPLLKALQGDPEPAPRSLPMRVSGNHPRKPGRREFMRATIGREGPLVFARILPNQASGAVTSFAQATALIIVPEDHGDVVDGEVLEVLTLSDG